MDRPNGLAVILMDLVFQRRNAEVPYLDGAIPEQHNVLGLDIPVHDAVGVGVFQRLEDMGIEEGETVDIHGFEFEYVKLEEEEE